VSNGKTKDASNLNGFGASFFWSNGVLRLEKTYQKYISDVMSGNEVACKWVKLAVKRHVDDLERSKAEGFPYFFATDEADFVIDFIGFCKHIKGKLKGQFIHLEPAQQFVIAIVFGWLKTGTTHRRFKFVYEEKARKNAKSTILAAIGLYMLFADGEGGAEVYSAAVDKEQAKIVWGLAKGMVDSSPDFKKFLSTYSGAIVHQKTVSTFKPLSRDNKNKDGLNVHCALVDEYHAHPDDSILELLKGGMGSRENPLCWIITTAGFERNCACKRERERIERILQGIDNDEEYFGIIYTLDDKDDWKDPRNWKKSNPLLDVAVSQEFLEALCRDAKVRPEKENNFKVKHLNLWVDAYTRWINHETWIKCRQDYFEESLHGRSCVAAFDFSTTIDLAGYCFVFDPVEEGEPQKTIFRFFLPEDSLDSRPEDVPYRAWANSGLIILTSGNVIDYDEIEDSFKKDAENYVVEEVAHDPWNATQVINHLNDSGFNCVQFAQNIGSMSPAIKHTETLIYKQDLAYNGNPIMDFMVSCVETKQDVNENRQFVKPTRNTSSKRIDGVVMMTMAAWRLFVSKGEKKGSVYEKRGIRWV